MIDHALLPFQYYELSGSGEPLNVLSCCIFKNCTKYIPIHFQLWTKIEPKISPRHSVGEKESQQSPLQSLFPHLPWSVRAEHTGALAFDHGNFNQSFSHFIGNSSPPSPFKHCLGELSAAGSISGNYTCKVTLGAGLNISAKCMCC